MWKSKKPEFEIQLEILRENCSLVWVAISTSSLLDTKTTFQVPEGKLEPTLARCGYSFVILKNIMRKSSRISQASTPDNIERYIESAAVRYHEAAVKSGIMKKGRSVQPGHCSTVIGEKPIWYLFKEPTIEKLVACVNEHLKAKIMSRLSYSVIVASHQDLSSPS